MPEFFNKVNGRIQKFLSPLSQEHQVQKEFFTKVSQQALETFQQLSDLGPDGQQSIAHFSPGSTLTLTDQNRFSPGTVFREKVQEVKTGAITYDWYFVGGLNPSNDQQLIIVGLHPELFSQTCPTFKLTRAINKFNKPFLTGKFVKKVQGKIEYLIGEGSFNDFHLSNFSPRISSSERFLKIKQGRNSLGVNIIVAGTAEKKKQQTTVPALNKLVVLSGYQV